MLFRTGVGLTFPFLGFRLQEPLQPACLKPLKKETFAPLPEDDDKWASDLEHEMRKSELEYKAACVRRGMLYLRQRDFTN